MKRRGAAPKIRATSASCPRWVAGLANSAALLFVHAAEAEQAAPATQVPANPVADARLAETPTTADEAAASRTPVREPRSVATTRLGFDVNIEGGAGSRTNEASVLGLGRLRLGMLAIIEPANPEASPLFVSTGPVFQTNGIATASVGLETELTHVTSGFWGQATALIDLGTIEPAWAASFGWSIFGVELERHMEHDGNGPHAVTALFGKIRAPLGIAWHSFR